MRDNSLSINGKKIQRFIKDLNNAEFIYLEHHLKLNDQINHLIQKFSLSKMRVCDLFNISEKNFENFVLGNMEYNIGHMACLNAAYVLLHAEMNTEDLEKDVPVKIASDV